MKKIVFLCLTAMVFLLNAQNTCLDFDGVDDYVEVPYSAELNPSLFTITFWVKVEGGEGTYRSPLSSRFVTSVWKGYMFYANTSDKWELVVGNGTGGVGFDSTNVDVSIGQWTHLAATYDGTRLKFYINGVLGSDFATSYVPNDQYPLRIAAGRNEAAAGYFVDGQVDEVQIWNIARTQQEINDDMYNVPTGSEDGLSAYYGFNEGSGIIAGDSAGSNNGTLKNMDDSDWVASSIFTLLIQNMSPSDNQTGVSADSNLELTFNKNVTAGSGNIIIHKTSDDSVVETIPASSVLINDSLVIINPTNNFELGVGYYVLIDSTSFHIGSGTYFDGIYDKTTWNFTTENYIESLSPADNSTYVSSETDLQIIFNTSVIAGAGNITICRSDNDSVTETIAAASTFITDSIVTIDILNTLELNTGYYVLIDSTSFHDGSGIYFEGIYDKTIWNFQTGGNFTDINAGLPDIMNSTADWGDYDNDGDFDIILTGNKQLVSNIYNNDAGTFTDINAGLLAVYWGSTDWGDFDNDGDLDLIVTGLSSSVGVSKIYRNDGNGVFTDINAGLKGVYRSSVAWGDYDNDGDLDILLTGIDETSVGVSKIYRNDGNGVFTDINAGLTGVSYSSAAWGDFDNDGDLDIILTGRDETSAIVSKIYRNDGNGVFTDINAGLEGVYMSSADWGDYDSDGDLDIVIAGFNGSVRTTKIYRNDGNGVFTDINAGLIGIQRGTVKWGDYDNDGDLDLIVTGLSLVAHIFKIYRNDAGVFIDIGAGLLGSVDNISVWGDYDNDGDLDILMSDSGESAKVYRNNSGVKNSVPSKPALLSADLEKSLLKFSISPGYDNETPQAGLSYNYHIEIDSMIVKPSMADTATGLRRIAKIGNASQNNFYDLDIRGIILPQEDKVLNLSWKVQAIDHCFAGSEFASIDTTVASIDLKVIEYDQMEAGDWLSWEYLFPDSIADYQLQLDDDINFGSPIEEILTIDRKKDSKIVNYNVALNELAGFDSLISNTRYYWRVKPNYIYRTGRYHDLPFSFIYNPTYSIPSPVNIAVMGEFVTLTWNNVKDAEKGEVYNVYSSDDPHAVFPTGWTKVAVAYTNEWTVKTSERKKFYCVTATGSVK